MIFILLYLYISQNHRKQEIVSDAAFKLWPFSSNFNSACKTGGVTIATCKYYCPLVVNPTITNCCKEFYLKYGRVPRSVFKNVAMHGNYSSFVWKPVFFIISKCCHLSQKSLYFSLVLFTVCWSIFDELLLPLSCFYGSHQWLFKVKITCKRVNFIKM